VRFDREKAKAETFEEKCRQQELQLKKAVQFMTDGNKAIKHKDTLLKQAEEKIVQLSTFIKQFSQLSDGKTLSLDAIKTAISL